MNDLITAATSGLFVEIGKVIEHMKAQQTRIADLERQLAEASAPAVGQQPVKPWEDRMQEYFAQGSVRMRTPAYFMADEIIDWRKTSPAAPQAADTDKVREALNGLPDHIMNLPCKVARAVAMHGATEQAYKEGHRDARHAAAELAASMAAQAPVREVPGWVSVKDRLPDMHTEVMVWPHPSDECMTAEVRGDGTWYYSEYTAHHGWDSVMLAVGRVTHWMPLPAAPV